MIRQGELVGRGVMAYETAEEVGTVEHLLVDVKLAQVVGLVCKAAGLMGRKQSLSWSQLVNVGRDSIVVHTNVPSASESSLKAAQDMTGLEVWTDGGDHIGKVIDLCLDQATGKVQQYLFALSPVTEQAAKQVTEPIVEDSAALAEPGEALAEEETLTVYAVEPQAIISAGRKRMMIAEEDARRSFAAGALPSQSYAQPLNVPTASSRPASWRPEQLPEMPTDFNELLQKGQSFAGKVTNQIKQRARQFTDEQLANQDLVEANSLPDITEQLQSKTEQVKQQMQAQLKKAKDKAQDQIDNSHLEDRLGNTSLGRSLGQTLDRFKRPKKIDRSEAGHLEPGHSEPDRSEPIESIDVEAFEVWEDD